MGSAAVGGYKSFCQVSRDGGATFSDVTEQTASTLSNALTTVSVTNKTTSPGVSGMVVEESVAVMAVPSASVDANLVEDALQIAMHAASLAGTALVFRFLRTKQAGTPVFQGSFLVDFDLAYPMTNQATAKYKLKPASGQVLAANTQ